MKFLNKKILAIFAIWGGLYFVWQSDFLIEPDAVYEDNFDEISDGRPPLPPPSRPSRAEDRPPLPPGAKPAEPVAAVKPKPEPKPEPMPAPQPVAESQPFEPQRVDPNLAKPKPMDPNLAPKKATAAQPTAKKVDPNLKPRKPASMPIVVKSPQAPPKRPKPIASVQSVKLPSVKNKTYRFKKKCEMRAQPSKSSPVVGTVRKSKKLWVEKSKPGWGKVFRKAGPAYVAHDCVL